MSHRDIIHQFLLLVDYRDDRRNADCFNHHIVHDCLIKSKQIKNPDLLDSFYKILGFYQLFLTFSANPKISIEREYAQRPVIYYTNGKEIYMWDDLDYPERKVAGFYTQKELQLLMVILNLTIVNLFNVYKEVIKKVYIGILNRIYIRKSLFYIFF